MTPNQDRAAQAAFDGYVKLPPREWRADCWGRERSSLYLGDLYVGSIIEWKPAMEGHEGKPWRAWFMSNDDGEHVGWYATPDEARAAVEAKLTAALAV